MKRRLKSSKASRGVWPKPLAPRCSFGPIKASQTLPTTLNLGRRCAAGLRGRVSKKSSMSSLMIGGSSSIWREITFRKRAAYALWISKLCRTQVLDEVITMVFHTKCRTRIVTELVGRLCQTPWLPGIQSRPQSMATEVVRLPPMLNVRNRFAFSIWRAPACSVSC